MEWNFSLQKALEQGIPGIEAFTTTEYSYLMVVLHLPIIQTRFQEEVHMCQLFTYSN